MENKKMTLKDLVDLSVQPKDANVGTVVNWGDREFLVRRHLPFQAAIAFVHSIIQMCTKDGDETHYVPELYMYAVNFNTVSFYTNIEMPQTDNGTAYNIITQSGIKDTIMDYVDQDQYTDLIEAVQQRIKQLTEVSAKKAEDKANEMLSAVESVVESMRKIVDTISADDIHSLAKALSDGSLSADAIAQAYKKYVMHSNEE